ncbi:hypothetical protein ACWJJH_13510 [Endozoicomonadaceae bacterium StTr2]
MLAPQYITDEYGKRVSVVLPLAQYEELFEDLEDLAAIAERRGEDTVSHEDAIRVLKKGDKL